MRVDAARATTRSNADPERTLAERQIDLVVQLAKVCARPGRWQGARDARTPPTCAFGLISAASVAWVEAAAANAQIRTVDVSIEAMASFAAIEASLATGCLQVVVAGAGPGLAGHLWAVPAARSQGATVLVLAPRTPPHLVGANDIQEVSIHSPLHLAGPGYFDEVVTLEDPVECHGSRWRSGACSRGATARSCCSACPRTCCGAPARRCPTSLR